MTPWTLSTASCSPPTSLIIHHNHQRPGPALGAGAQRVLGVLWADPGDALSSAADRHQHRPRRRRCWSSTSSRLGAPPRRWTQASLPQPSKRTGRPATQARPGRGTGHASAAWAEGVHGATSWGPPRTWAVTTTRTATLRWKARSSRGSRRATGGHQRANMPSKAPRMQINENCVTGLTLETGT